MMIYFAGFILIASILLSLFQLVRLKFFWQNHKRKDSSWPLVSVLVSARNEEAYLPRLLRSFEKLDYPEERIEFLIINDQSQDQTGKIIMDWCRNKSNRYEFLSSYDVRVDQWINGKSAALAILCKEAKGEFMFFTDSDCLVNSNWIKEGVSCFQPKTGILIGITKVEATSVFGKFQELEWWNTLGQVKIAADLGLQTTGLGNNMVIRKTAYELSGGFEKTLKSLTEDLEISRMIHETGFKLEHQISAPILAFTKSEPDLKALLNQRKRWFDGVMTLPFFWLILLNLQFLYLPALLVFAVKFPLLGLFIFILKLSLNGSMIHLLVAQTSQKIDWLYVLFFDFYSFLINSLTILYYFYPSKITWKSRTYP